MTALAHDAPPTFDGTPLSRFVDGHARRAMIIGSVTVLAMITVVVAVFSMADRAASVADKASELHALDLTEREVDRARHLIASAVLMADLDEALSASAATEATSVLDEVAAASAAGLTHDVVALDELVTSGRVVLDLLEAGHHAAAQDAVASPFTRAYTTSVDDLRDAQRDVADDIDDAKSLLRTFGALGGFAVAFVVPVVGTYLYRQLAHRSDEALELDATLRARLAVEAKARREIVEIAVDARRALDESPDLARERLNVLAALASFHDGRSEAAAAPVEVRGLLSELPQIPGLERRVTVDGSPDLTGDRRGISAAMASLEWAAHLHEAQRVTFEQDRDGISVALHDVAPGPVSSETIAAIRAAERLASAAGLTFDWDPTSLRATLMPVIEIDPQVPSAECELDRQEVDATT